METLHVEIRIDYFLKKNKKKKNERKKVVLNSLSVWVCS